MYHNIILKLAVRDRSMRIKLSSFPIPARYSVRVDTQGANKGGGGSGWRTFGKTVE